MDLVEKSGNGESQVAIIPKETSMRITSLRFLLAIFVVFIHNNFTVEYIAQLVEQGAEDIYFKPNIVSEWIQLVITQGLAQCAVPLFFLFAAYLQARKADCYKTLLKKKLKTLVIPYVLWIS